MRTISIINPQHINQFNPIFSESLSWSEGDD